MVIISVVKSYINEVVCMHQNNRNSKVFIDEKSTFLKLNWDLYWSAVDLSIRKSISVESKPEDF